jgi:exosome complex RNA-binding protein Rrp4
VLFFYYAQVPHSLTECRRIVSSLLQGGEMERLAAKTAFECAIGANGRVWVKSGTVPKTIELAKEIRGRP